MSARLDGDALLARAREMAGRQAVQRRQGIADGIEAAFPELRVTVADEAVVVEGRDLLNRWLNEARLREVMAGGTGGGGR